VRDEIRVEHSTFGRLCARRDGLPFTMMNMLRRLSERVFGVPKRPPSDDDLVLLGVPDSEAEAVLWSNILEQWGIRCLVRNVSVTAYLRMGDSFQVWVLQRDFEEARALIEGDAPSGMSAADRGNSSPEFPDAP
jgi:hypothetical protein